MAIIPRPSGSALAARIANVEAAIGTPGIVSTGSTTARSLAARFADVVNVKDYLPVGQPDGTTDNAAGIQAADAAAGAVKGTVYFPPGTYRYNATGATYVAQAVRWQGGGSVDEYEDYGAVIRCYGANGGNAFFRPPADMADLTFDGIDKAGDGLAAGVPGSFGGGAKKLWRNIVVRNFNVGIRSYEAYMATYDTVTVTTNHEGWRMDLPDGAGDDGYFTSTLFVKVFVADNDVRGMYVNAANGVKTWQWVGGGVERNGASGTEQVYLQNVTLAGLGVSFEGTPSVPMFKVQSTTLRLQNSYFTNTGGIDAQSLPVTIHFNGVGMGSTDVIANLVASTTVLHAQNSSVTTAVDVRGTSFAKVLLVNTQLRFGGTTVFLDHHLPPGEIANSLSVSAGEYPFLTLSTNGVNSNILAQGASVPLQIGTNNTVRFRVRASGIPTYADNAAATGAGLAAADLYRTATGQLMIVY